MNQTVATPTQLPRWTVTLQREHVTTTAKRARVAASTSAADTNESRNSRETQT